MGIIETIQMLAKEEGLEKGREEEKVIIIKNFLTNSDLDIVKIAMVTGVSENFVKKIQADLNNNR